MARRRVLKKQIQRDFPSLASSAFRITSRRTRKYNCIAWAAGDNNRWWEPAPGYFWPNKDYGDFSIAAAIKAYEAISFEICHSTEYETGCEKIAIYADADGYTHAARQMADGRWTSIMRRQIILAFAAKE